MLVFMPNMIIKNYYENKYDIELDKGMPKVLYLIMGSQFGDKAPRMV